MATGTNLKKLREFMENSKNEEGGNYNWWKPKDGDNLIRVLPSIEPDGIFFFATARHRVNGKFYYCLKYHMDSETGKPHRCPLCEARTKLFRSNDKELIKIAKDIKAKQQFLMNVIDRKSDDPTKVYVYAAGVKLIKKMTSEMIDDDIDITLPDAGYDYQVKKEMGPKQADGTQFPAYDNSKAKRTSTPLHSNVEVIEKILTDRVELDRIPRFEDAEVLQQALDEFISSLHEGTAQTEKFYQDEGAKEAAPSKNPADSEAAKSKLTAFKAKLADQLRSVEDDEDKD